ncbi:MAG: non-canonical purine NTP pyrophosphatase [Acidobacteria bacterium]|nr:non-canonical purine NTP pyrophosphatase [Acidobacteriota bacterium]
MRVVLATRNAGKLGEFQDLLPGVELLPWPAEAPELPETGAFFHDNALQKAREARAWWQARAKEGVDGFLADDSGLCVDALWGGPGVLSARFASGHSQDEKNRMLLGLLPGGAPRTARFVCVLAYYPAQGEPWTVDGAIEGTLAREPSGCGGFGYDPIFIPEGHDRTFGELPAEVKHGLSHRGRAARALALRLGACP